MLLFIPFLSDTLVWVANILGRALEDPSECILEFLLKLFSLLKYVVLITFLIELFRSDIITEE
jgi:hypothetical protein